MEISSLQQPFDMTQPLADAMDIDLDLDLGPIPEPEILENVSTVCFEEHAFQA